MCILSVQLSPVADGLDTHGNYLNNPDCDYKPPLELSGQIHDKPITNTNRTVCYQQELCPDNERVEGDEVFGLKIIKQDRTTENVEIGPVLVVTLLDDECE